MRNRFVFQATIMSLLSPIVFADVEYQNCTSTLPEPISSSFDSDTILPQGWIDIKANETHFIRDGVSVFRDDVHVIRDDRQLQADTITYHKRSSTLTASGNVIFSDNDLIMQGREAEWITSTDEGGVIEAHYWLKDSRVNGKAKYIYRSTKQNTHLANASYTSCQRDEPFWALTADSVTLDHQQAVGEADNVILQVADIPVFYTPYLNFPLNNKRKTGLLVPSFGTSKQGGIDFTLPYYWNISSSQDLTASPRYITDRGIKLDAEYRYLNAYGEGILDLGWLGDDNLVRHGSGLNPYYGRIRKILLVRYRWTTYGTSRNRV